MSYVPHSDIKCLRFTFRMSILNSEVDNLFVELPNFGLNHQVDPILNFKIWLFRCVGVLGSQIVVPAEQPFDSISVEQVLHIWIYEIFAQPVKVIEVLQLVKCFHVLERVRITEQLTHVDLFEDCFDNLVWQVANDPQIIFLIGVATFMHKYLKVFFLRYLDK